MLPSVGGQILFLNVVLRLFWHQQFGNKGKITNGPCFHGGCWAKVAIFASGVQAVPLGTVQGRTNIGLALILDAVSQKANHAAPCA